jgi:microcystin-dependent protein
VPGDEYRFYRNRCCSPEHATVYIHFIHNQHGGMMLVGSIYMFAGAVAPSGYAVCDGTAVSRSTYAELFGIIGTTYGAGDGSTTFNLPDLSGRVPLGVSTAMLLGDSGGEEAHVLTVNEIPQHLHTVPQHGHTDNIVIQTPELSHTVTQPAYNYERPNGTTNMGNARPNVTSYSGTSSVDASRSGSIAVEDHAGGVCTVTGGVTDAPDFDTETSGQDEGHSNMQPYLTLNFIIYTGV